MINSLYDFEKLIKVNGPAHRGARMPAVVDVAINQSKMPDNMRPKHYQVDILDENSIQLYWMTQEPFTTDDAEKALNEVKRAINAIVKANDYTEHLNVHVTFECRDGASEGYEDFTFTVNDEVKNENISIRESLNRLDAETCNNYDLLNTYNSVALNEGRKATLAKMLKEHADAKKIARFLINESQSKDLKESLNESDDFDWSIYDDYGYDDYEDDWDHANTYGGDLTDCPICGKRLSYDEDGETYCDRCGEDAHTLAMKRRARDKKLDEDVTGSDVKGIANQVATGVNDLSSNKEKAAALGQLVDNVSEEDCQGLIDMIKDLVGELKLNAEARKYAKEQGIEADNLETIGDLIDFGLKVFDNKKVGNGIKIIIKIVFTALLVFGLLNGPMDGFIIEIVSAIILLIPGDMILKVLYALPWLALKGGQKLVRGAQARKKAKAAQTADIKEAFSYEDDELTEFFDWVQSYKNGALWDDFTAEFESVDEHELNIDDILEWLEQFNEDAYYDFINLNGEYQNNDIDEAFSCEDSEFFTREEVDDFAEKVCEHVNETFNEVFDVQESYITNNEIEVVVYNDELGEFTGKKKVDMRRIRKPSDLDKYVLDIAANIIADIKKAKDIDESLKEDSDEETPYSYKETETELQSLTQNWTREKDQLKCGYDEEKNYGMEILSKHGYECKADRQGGWWVVDYWKEPIKENKADIIDSQNEEITFDVLDENEELIKTFSGRDYDKLIEFVNTNPDAYFVEKHEPVEVDGFGYEEPEMQTSSYYVFDRSEDDSLTYQMLREALKEAWSWEPEFKTEDGWTEEDIAKWKEIDWEPLLKQHIGEVAVPEDTFIGKAVLYGDGYKPQYKQVKFVKKLHSNPIYPPNYEPEENPFPEHCGPMYDGTKRNGLMVHDRYETWANYDMLSK